MALSRAQIQVAFQNSLGRAASASDENSYFSVSQSGALTDAQIFSTISNSREADQIADPVIRFYQAAFGRVPDQAGLQNAENFVRALGPSAATYQNLSNMFAQSTEFTNRFGTGTAVDAAYVQALYSTILGRTATSGEVDGYVNAGGTRGNVLYLVSQSQEAIGISDNAVNGFQQNAAQGQAVYTGSLYTAGNGQPNSPGSNGSSIQLTVNPDNITGTAGNDIINGVVGTGATFSAADIINGGAGTDTLSVITDGSFSVFGNNVTNVETLRVFATSTATATVTGTSFTTLENNGSTAGLTFTGAGTVGAVNISNTAQSTTVTYTDAAVTGAADTATVNLTAVTGAAAVAINSVTNNASGVETISLVSNGSVANSITLSENDTGLTRINISGGAALTVALDAGIATVATIDASADTGGVTISGFGTAAQTVTGGTGNDRFIFAGELTATDTVSGGAGIDTLSANGATLAGFTTASRPTLTGFETIEIGNDVGANATVIDASVFGSINNIRIDDQGATGVAAVTISNIAAATNNNFRFDGNLGDTGGSYTFDITGATTGGVANAATFDFRGGATTATSTISLAGVETLTVDTTNATGTQTFALTDPALTTLTVNGAQSVNIGTLGTAVGTVNASGLTGTAGITVTLNGSSISGGTVTGGNGVDTIVGSQLADTINGGAGADSITGGQGADTLTGGAGIDNFILTLAGTDTGVANGFTASTAIPTAVVNTVALDKITDFGTGADTITTGVTTGAGLIRNGGTLGAANAGDGALVRGTFDATAQTFSANASGTSSLFVYDNNGTTAGGDYRGVVLVGYVDTGVNDTFTAGVLTAVA